METVFYDFPRADSYVGFSNHTFPVLGNSGLQVLSGFLRVEVRGGTSLENGEAFENLMRVRESGAEMGDRSIVSWRLVEQGIQGR